MQIRLEILPIEKLSVDALAVLAFEPEEGNDGSTGQTSTPVSPVDPDITTQAGWMAELRSSGEFTGKLYEMATLYRPGGTAAKRLVVIGAGKREKLSTVETRRIAGVLVRELKTKGVKSIALLLEGLDLAEHAEAAAEGAVLGAWEADKYKSDPKKHAKLVEDFSLIAGAGDSQTLKTLIERGRVIAEAQNFTRDLVNEPPNQLVPENLVQAAQAMATEFGLECDVLDDKAMQALGMGALLGVAQGSSNPPFLIAVKYRPSITSGQDHLALIGKGVTFDTGGISIKPADGMEKMKYDMAGAAAVLGALRAIAQLKPALPVTGYIPTVENMLNGNAQRPGDIVTSLAGKTIEVLNTDAEGRLILADAITYARRNQATHLVDAATLTGAIGIALGHHNVGAFTNHQDFLNQFLAASRSAGEKIWQLPMDEEYKDYLKSAFADLPNIGGRYGGSITAAWFLREFADPTPWVHLDIAATAWLDDPKPWLSKGPSGVAMRSFVQLALDWPSAA
jgi:leucyl aminopeptidase